MFDLNEKDEEYIISFEHCLECTEKLNCLKCIENYYLSIENGKSICKRCADKCNCDIFN